MEVFGTDYPTPDGSCLRDYIHVTDLVQAHVDALARLRAGGGNLVCNVGYAQGLFRARGHRRGEARLRRRFPGDSVPAPPRRSAAAIVASNARIRRELGWTPRARRSRRDRSQRARLGATPPQPVIARVRRNLTWRETWRIAGPVRHRGDRRRRQWLRHRPRRRRARPFGLSVRAGRSRERHLLALDEADPRRPCATSNTTSSAWCTRRWPSARCCGAPRRISSGRCASCCRITRACGRPGCCGSACSSTTISAAGRPCPPTRTLDLRRDPAGEPLKDRAARAFEYSDCWVDDARLVVLNALDAARPRRDDRNAPCAGRGAPRERRLAAHDRGPARAARANERRAKVLVNAAGPWVDGVLGMRHAAENGASTRAACQRLPYRRAKLYDHDRCYIFQNADGRIIFAIPYERDFTLIGTTDLDYERRSRRRRSIRPTRSTISAPPPTNISRAPSTRDDIVWTYSGVRPLYDDGASAAQEATRDYVLSSMRRRAARRCSPCSAASSPPTAGWPKRRSRNRTASAGRRQAWTASGDPAGRRFSDAASFARSSQSFAARYPALPADAADAARPAYGTRHAVLLAMPSTQADLGRDFRRRTSPSGSALSHRRRMGAHAPRTCCGGAASSACAAEAAQPTGSRRSQDMPEATGEGCPSAAAR